MAKTISVAQLGHGGASRAIRDAQDEPVLVSKENRPAAWIISSERLAEVASARGVDPDVYDRALELFAVKLYEQGASLSVGRPDWPVWIFTTLSTPVADWECRSYGSLITLARKPTRWRHFCKKPKQMPYLNGDRANRLYRRYYPDRPCAH